MRIRFSDIQSIVNPHSECGNEREYAEYLSEVLKEFTSPDKIKVDVMNNVIAYIGDPSKYTIMLEAHLDEIGLVVQSITDDGFVHVRNVGGIDRRALPSSEVSVNGQPAVVCNLPPHLSSDSKKVPEYKDLYLDLGLDCDEVKKIVSIGDYVKIEHDCFKLQNSRIACRSGDDKICIFTILHALRLLFEEYKPEELNFCIAILFASQEEVGSNGARAGAFEIDPDEAIVLDVTFADEPANKSHIKLGKGVVIEHSGFFDRKMVRTLRDLAVEKKIDYQSDVSVRSPGTDAVDVALTCNFVSTALLSFPQRHMHTQGEVVDIKDIESTSKLLYEYMKHLNVRIEGENK